MNMKTNPVTIKGRVTRIAMMLLFAMMTALTAQAVDFITNVMVIGNSNKTNLYNLQSYYEAQGWTAINDDLNAGCGSNSDYIHLLYKMRSSTDSSGTPITDFYIKTGKNPPDDLAHDGRTYHLVPYDGSTNFKDSEGDLNRGAGGDYIHLYYTTDPYPDHRIVTAITFNNTQSGSVGSNGGTTGYDLNTGCGSGSEYIYMHVTIEPLLVTLTSESGDVELHDGVTITGTGGANTRVTIADGATVTLSGVNITAISTDNSHQWAGVTCLGDAVIVLDEGTTNDVKAGYSSPGIFVPEGKTLTIQGSGTVNAYGGILGAGIGGCAQVSCGNITISGGTVNAYGENWAASIGTGSTNSRCGDITISGGTVNAYGGKYGAGIGSGHIRPSCGNITISGGTVTATGGDRAAGIGSGYDNSSCGTITISGGTVNAYCGDYSAGIGSGYYYSSCGDITISGGTIAATGGYKAAVIGSGYYYSSCGDITIADEMIDVSEGKTRTLWPGLVIRDNDDNTTAISKYADGETHDVWLRDRTLYKDRSWNTLCLPFSISSEQVNTILNGRFGKRNLTIMELDTEGEYFGRQSGLDACTGILFLYFKEVSTIEAGKPYIIKWDSWQGQTDATFEEDADIEKPIFESVTVTSTAPTAVTSKDGIVSFVGNYNAVSISGEDKSILFLSGNTLNYPNDDMTVGACRAFFRLNDDSSVKYFVLNFGEEDATGISEYSEYSGYSENSEEWYDMSGRRLNGKPLQRGVFIHNGTKVTIK